MTDKIPLHYDQEALLVEIRRLEAELCNSQTLQGRYKQLSENLQREVDGLSKHLKHWMQESERLKHLHDLDHSLADQWQKKNEALRMILGEVREIFKRHMTHEDECDFYQAYVAIGAVLRR
ncbi:MAG: hypothetical protein ACYSW3_00490 [Planctomycetota bacterium]|jgi:hypothetical protein